MHRDRFLLFDPDRFLCDVIGRDFTEAGCVAILMALAWREPHRALPADREWLRSHLRAFGFSGHRWAWLTTILDHHFTLDPTGQRWHHDYLDRQAEARARSLDRKAAWKIARAAEMAELQQLRDFAKGDRL